MTTRQDAYERFNAFYDLEYAAYEDDIPFYLAFAQEANGPVVELGCGTGRVLQALEATGLPLAGIDSSESMLAVARGRVGREVVLARWDMRDIEHCPALTNGPYFMAFSAINTFLHLPDADAQVEALNSIRGIMVTGGLLLLDLMTPDARYLSELDGRPLLEFSGRMANGDHVDKWVVRTHDQAQQTIDTTVMFDVTSVENGTLTRVRDSYVTRYIHRFELEHLLHRTGWEIVSLYGSYELEPFDSSSERMLVLATWGSGEPNEEDSEWLPSN